MRVFAWKRGGTARKKAVVVFSLGVLLHDDVVVRGHVHGLGSLRPLGGSLSETEGGELPLQGLSLQARRSRREAACAGLPPRRKRWSRGGSQSGPLARLGHQLLQCFQSATPLGCSDSPLLDILHSTTTLVASQDHCRVNSLVDSELPAVISTEAIVVTAHRLLAANSLPSRAGVRRGPMCGWRGPMCGWRGQRGRRGRRGRCGRTWPAWPAWPMWPAWQSVAWRGQSVPCGRCGRQAHERVPALIVWLRSLCARVSAINRSNGMTIGPRYIFSSDHFSE